MHIVMILEWSLCTPGCNTACTLRNVSAMACHSNSRLWHDDQNVLLGKLILVYCEGCSLDTCSQFECLLDTFVNFCKQSVEWLSWFALNCEALLLQISAAHSLHHVMFLLFLVHCRNCYSTTCKSIIVHQYLSTAAYISTSVDSLFRYSGFFLLSRTSQSYKLVKYSHYKGVLFHSIVKSLACKR